MLTPKAPTREDDLRLSCICQVSGLFFVCGHFQTKPAQPGVASIHLGAAHRQVLEPIADQHEKNGRQSVH